MSRATSLPGAEVCFLENRLLLKKPLVLGSFAAWGRTVYKKKNGLSRILGLLCAEQEVGNPPKNGLSGIMGLLRAEQDVGNLKRMHVQEFWDSCAQNKTSEISKNAFSGVLGLARRRKSQKNARSRIPGLLCAPQTPKGRSAPLAAVVGLFSLDRVTCP